MGNYWSRNIFCRNIASAMLTGLKACFYECKFTSHVLRLTFLTLCILQFAICNSASAAPHITRGKPEPSSKVGKHFSERMKAKAFAPMLANATTGTVKGLFLKVDFPADTDATTTGNGTWTDPVYACNADLAPGVPSPVATDPLCTANPYDYWVNKDESDFISYYNEVSYGQLNLTVDVFPQAAGTAYRLPNPMASYGTEKDTALNSLIVDSVTKAEAVDGATINFAKYDAILIVHAGPGEETDTAPSANGCSANAGNSCYDLWSLNWSQSTTIVTADGKSFSEAIIMPQTGTQDGGTVDPLGIYVHEFGHWLGLPDLYYTAPFPPNVWDGVGKWSLMGDGIYLGSPPGSSPAHLDAWCKKFLGWVTPQTISTDLVAVSLPPINELALTPAQANQRMLKLQASTTTPSQYFLLENRQQTGFDSGLPGSGLLVWLIDEAVINGNMANNTVNNNPLRPGVKLIEADGNNDLMSYGGDYGGPGDPFPYTINQSFTPYTKPASTPNLGSAWLYLNNIAVSGSNIISATIGFSPVALSGLAVSHNSVTRLTWTAGTEADLSKYKVYRNSTFLAETTETQYTDTTSSNGDTYAVTAVDSNGYESGKSTSVTVTFSTSGGGGGGGCFIATAAYGSYEAPYVKILREFRDSYLLTNIIGNISVEFYYKVSPPIADFIRESEVLKFLVRIVLLPMIGMAAFLVKTTFLQKCIAFGVLIIGQAFFVHRLRRPVRLTHIQD